MNGALSDIVQYFNLRASTSDVSSALQMTSFITSIAVLLVQVLGLTGIAIWISRIAIDMLLIAGKGMPGMQKLERFGTGDSSSYQSVTAYLGKNLLNILLTVVLIVFFATGWIFKLFAIALQGTGAIMARLLNLDVGRMFSKQEISAYKNNVESSRYSDLLTDYDNAVASAESNLNKLQEMRDVSSDNPEKIAIMREYTNAIYTADIISKRSGLAEALNKNSSHFKRHLEPDRYCNTAFFDQEVSSAWGGAISCGVN